MSSVPSPCEGTPLVSKEPSGFSSRLAASACLVLTSGAGLFADGYDLLVIDLVVADISHLHPGAMGPAQKSFTVSLTLLGVVLGQLCFGTVADIVGAKAASMVTASLIAVGALASACCVEFGSFPLAAQLGLCRLVLGLGVGGEYPVSAALAVSGHGSAAGADSEAFCGSRAQLQALVGGMFNLGSVLTGAVVLLLLHSGLSLEAVWRWALGLGAAPALLALVSRAYLPTGEQPTQRTSARSVAVFAEFGPGDYLRRLSDAVGPRRTVLLGASLSWAVFNLTMYGQGSFRSIISERIYGSTEHQTVWAALHQNAVFSLTMSFCACAGIVVAVLLIDKLRRFQLQLLGFAGSAVCMWVCGWMLGGLAPELDWPLAMCNYLWIISYMQVGVVTYLVPAECFPATARATCFGIAAASGKIGALVGTALFPICEAAFGLESVLIASGFVSLLGVGVTLMLTPRVDVDPAKLDAECEQSREDSLPVCCESSRPRARFHVSAKGGT